MREDRRGSGKPSFLYSQVRGTGGRPRHATQGHVGKHQLGQEVGEARGKHGLELLLWSLWKGMGEEGLPLISLEQV